jgi:hypothetical protein
LSSARASVAAVVVAVVVLVTAEGGGEVLPLLSRPLSEGAGKL